MCKADARPWAEMVRNGGCLRCTKAIQIKKPSIQDGVSMSSPYQQNSRFNRLYISAFMIALSVALGVLVALQFSYGRYQEDVRNWQMKLSLIADSRLGAVDAWVEAQFGEMRKLADNEKVAAFLPDGKGDRNYLRNLLAISSERSGFGPDMRGTLIGEKPAPNGGGIALLAMDGTVRLASEYMPPVQGELSEFVQSAAPAVPQLYDLVAPVDGGAKLRMGFLMPVMGGGAEGETSQQLGWVLGMREVEPQLFQLLHHPGTTEVSLETILVREENGGITYISPLMDGTLPMRKHLSMPTNLEAGNALAAGFAMNEPGQFSVHEDYRGRKVLVTGRKVPGTNWWLLSKVDENEALADAKSRRTSLLLQLLLGVAVVFALVVAAWRHGTSRDASRLARKLEIALQKATTREQMLEVITNTQPGAIFITDTSGHCAYANESFAEQLGLSRDAVVGKKIEALVGPVVAMEYERASDAALADQKTIIWTRRTREEDGTETVMRVKHIPLNQLPMEYAPAGARGVLVLEYDITAVVVERERRARTLRSLVDTLVAMVDRRDPYAANHSKMVATISREVAQEMEQDAATIETAEIAGTVMNIGKMEVPAEWLTKPGALNEQERKAIRDALLESADMLEGIEFDGPVAETLRQSLEHYNGKGPQKLKGDDILVTARIVAAANAFVGMVSPRSYRKAMDVDEALKVLMKGIDKEFDRKVVVALANYVDNRGGRALIADHLPQEKD